MAIIDTSASLSKTNTIASNIMASGSTAEKGFQVALQTSVIPTGQNGHRFSGATALTTQNISQQGAIQSSSNKLSLAINGPGYTPVVKLGTDPSTGIFVTRSLNCTISSSGNLVTDTGFSVLGWKLDDNGKLPGEPGNSNTIPSQQLDSLTVINLNGLASRPKATTNVSIDGRLSATQDAMKGAGQGFKFDISDAYNGGINLNELIVPSGKGIAQGDLLQITVNSNVTVLEYGGITNTLDLKTQPVFGATDALTTFSFVNNATAAINTPIGGKASDGDTLTVRVGVNQAVVLKFVGSGTPSINDNEFNSLYTLSNVLNTVKGLTSRVVGGVLYAAAENGRDAVTFVDTGSNSTAFTKMLGLSNVDAYTGSNERYSTLAGLRTAAQTNTSLSITRKLNEAGVRIHALNPLTQIEFLATSERKVSFSTVSGTQVAVTDSAAEKLTSMKIHSPNSGLKAGDYVRMSAISVPANSIFGTAAHVVPAGIYIVNSSDTGGFTISADAQIFNGGVGAAGITQVTGNPTWTKVPGFTDGANQVTCTAADSLTSGAGVAGATLAVTITNAGAFVTGDSISIKGIGNQGGVVVPDGVYRVTANVANTSFTISVPGIATIAGAVGPAAMTGGTITKVGTSASASNAIETSAIFANPGTSIVRIYMPNHGFNVDDYVAFMGTNVPASLVGNSYKITSKGTLSGTNYFEFDMGSTNVAAAAALAASPDLPVGMQIDCFSAYDNNVGLSSSLDGIAMESVFDPADGSGKNLVTGGSDFDIFNTSINIYDSLGNPFGLNVAFAKTSNSQWTYQLYFARDAETNAFPVSNVGSDGILQGGTGTIIFDGKGAIQSVDNVDMDLKWLSGSNATTFALNFGKSALDTTAIFTTGGVKQASGVNEIFSANQDGYAPGKFIGITLDPSSGSLIASYDNGENQSIYMLPIVYISSPNKMAPVGNATFQPTADSGPIVLKQVGENGVGNYIPSSIELSNIDNNAEMVSLIEEANRISYLHSAQSTVNDVQRQLASN